MVGDLAQPLALLLVQRANQLDGLLDAMDHRVGLLAVGAILHMDPFLAQPHHHLLQRPLLARGVYLDGHRGTAAQRGEQQVIRAWPRIEAD